jgi:hypothetical protein
MPRIKRYFPVSQDINDDDEVWELTNTFGDRSLRTWMEILRVLDKDENRLRLSDEWFTTASGKVRQQAKNLRRQIGWMLTKGWLASLDAPVTGLPTVLYAPNYAKYHRTQVPFGKVYGSDSGADDAPLLTDPSLPNLTLKEKHKNAFVSQGGFQDFWDAYPKRRRKAKQAALKAWKKLKVDEALLVRILDALAKHSKTFEWTKSGGQFIPLPATWLNGHRWEDEITELDLGAPDGKQSSKVDPGSKYDKYDKFT